MAWKYPKYNNTDGEPIDAEAINVNFEAFIRETQGNLNEHNWASGAFTDAEDYEIGACLRIDHSYDEVTPMAAQTAAPANIAAIVSGTAYQTIAVYDWDVVDSTQIICDTALLWVIASFQHSVSNDFTRYGVQYGLRLDGVVIAETVTGSGGRNTDSNGEGLDGDGTNMPLVLDAILPVLSGPHTIELVARMCTSATIALPPTAAYWMVCNRELIVVEMH